MRLQPQSSGRAGHTVAATVASLWLWALPGTAQPQSPPAEAPPAEAPPGETPPAEAPPAQEAAPVEADPFAQAEAEAEADPFAAAEAEDEAPPVEAEAEAPSLPDADEVIEPEEDLFTVEEVEVRAPPLEMQKRETPGAVSVVSEQELEQFEFDDAHQVLSQVAGVYVRQEDGYGLRPNIGLRGVSADRSKKITLMEDLVLFGPAPYSAPAAYYFPLITRMVGVEVTKGAGSILYGPQTIGGSFNLRTRDVPDEGHVAAADLAGGNTLYAKGHAYYGYGTRYWGLLLEGVHLHSDGFKQLDGGGDTGFSKQEFMVKLRANSNPANKVYMRHLLKLQLARENSNETYLGLTDADFRASPLRRYRPTALDEVNWLRTSVTYTALLGVGENIEAQLDAYRHDFQRDWDRLDAFSVRGVRREFVDILSAPDVGSNALPMAMLRGQATSEQAETELLQAGNDRRFVSQGVQAAVRWFSSTGPVEHALDAGVRVHFDRIERDHKERTLRIGEGGVAEVDVAQGVRDTLQNEGRSLAVAMHVTHKLDVRGLTLRPGVRAEFIRSELRTPGEATVETPTQRIVTLGLGAHYALTEELGVLAGAHQGFSPVGPGQTADPERAINYEAGARYVTEQTLVEWVGFFSDYDNVLGQPSVSSGSGLLDQQFNGGAAWVYGLELSGKHRWGLPAGWGLPVRANYTFTRTQFRSAFTSANPQWGDVEKGDELPYVPRHRGSVTVGFDWRQRVGLDVLTSYVDDQRETAGQGAVAAADQTDDYTLVDVSAYGQLLDNLRVYAKAENLLDNQPLVARRPFGARPVKARLFIVGLKGRL